MIKDYLTIIFRNFARRRVRGWLTVVGILIGIAAVVSLVSLGQGLQVYISEQFELMGADKIMIMPGKGLMGAMSTDITLTNDDLNTIKKVKGVKVAGGMVYGQSNVRFKEETKTTYVIGLPQDETREVIESMQQMRVLHGRDLKEEDKNKIVIGILLYEGDFFDEKVKLRDSLEIKGKEFKVVGVFDRIGNPADDSQVYISLEDARELFDQPEDYNWLMAQVIKGADVNAISEAIEKQLRKTRGVEEGDEDFSVQTSEQMMSMASSIISIVQAIIVAIAAISLLVGGIGIMNTMYTSVLERTREIGIMKAIGAKNSDIASIFLIESGLLGLGGGVIGVAIGIGFSKLVEFGASAAGYGIVKAAFPWYLILGSLIFSFVVGALSGTMPAIQASKMKPVDALRYE